MGFGIDMAKAREIHKAKIREARTPKLAELDIEFQRALETSADTSTIVAKKQAYEMHQLRVLLMQLQMKLD